MVDAEVFETVEIQQKNPLPSAAYKAAILEFERLIPDFDATKNGVVSVNKILLRVFEWEKENLNKVSSEEVEALELLSLVLGTVDVVRNKESLGTPTQTREARIKSIETQREVVRIVFSNLCTDGRPNEIIMRAMSLVTRVFEEKFDLKPDRLYERGLEKYIGFWQGVMGMVTAAQMFHMMGWEVAFGSVKLDLEHDVDLVVKDKKGRRYAVDVGAKTAGYHVGDEMYRITKSPETNRAILDAIRDANNRIGLNIPPLRANFESFYDTKRRATGTPSISAIEKLKKVLM